MKGCQLVILRFLLTKADFFVDGKDLQTFVSATLRSRFFFARLLFVPALAAAGRRRVRLFVRLGHDGLRPIFHHVVTRIERRREQVLPMIAMPGGIEFGGERRGRRRCTTRIAAARNTKPVCEAFDAVQHDSLPRLSRRRSALQSSLRAATRTNTKSKSIRPIAVDFSFTDLIGRAPRQ